jgi:hypothetical protein
MLIVRRDTVTKAARLSLTACVVLAGQPSAATLNHSQPRRRRWFIKRLSEPSAEFGEMIHQRATSSRRLLGQQYRPIQVALV